VDTQGRHARTQKRNRRRKNRAIRRGALLSLGLAMGVSLWYFLKSPLKPAMDTHPIAHAHHMPPPTPHRTNILLIGTDARPHDVHGNTDALVLASIDEIHHRIEMLSIPRDTQVAFPDGRYYKINHSLEAGGPNMAMNLVENLLGTPVNYYALTHFDGLVNIIDTMGGLTVNVKERMRYDTGDRKYHRIHLNRGLQKLTGAEALGYVRFRHDELGDIGRTARQQVFLKALIEQFCTTQNLKRLPQLVPEIWSSVETDMSVLEVTALATKQNKIRSYALIHETLPGSFHNPTPGNPMDLSYWVVNPAQSKYVAKQFFEGGVVVKNPIQDPQVTQTWQIPSAPSPTSSLHRPDTGTPTVPPDAPIRVTNLPPQS
jgi:polyisoprenyl-teichoic acid--peptidoglycan teichoic acid transferase